MSEYTANNGHYELVHFGGRSNLSSVGAISTNTTYGFTLTHTGTGHYTGRLHTRGPTIVAVAPVMGRVGSANLSYYLSVGAIDNVSGTFKFNTIVASTGVVAAINVANCTVDVCVLALKTI